MLQPGLYYSSTCQEAGLLSLIVAVSEPASERPAAGRVRQGRVHALLNFQVTSKGRQPEGARDSDRPLIAQLSATVPVAG
jgi:hypothetical protein